MHRGVGTVLIESTKGDGPDISIEHFVGVSLGTLGWFGLSWWKKWIRRDAQGVTTGWSVSLYFAWWEITALWPWESEED